MSSRINPYNQFVGSFIPNWLLRRPEISSGAKLCYARLCQYAGRNGECFPRQETISAEIGVSLDSIQRYIKELVQVKLIEAARCGMGKPNRYFFLSHPWNSTDISQADLRHQTQGDPWICGSSSVDLRFQEAVNLRSQSPSEQRSEGKESVKREKENPDGRKRPGLKSDFVARKSFTDAWCHAWQEAFGTKYPFDGIRDVKAADALLCAGAVLPDLFAVADWAWKGFGGRWAKDVSVSLASFGSNYNRLLAMKTAEKGSRRALQASDHEKGW